MGYVLLTGATGLLGTYLVRDWVKAGVNLALLVRPTRWASARQRVESLVEHWEKQAGYALPRPVVLEGHLHDDSLGLDEPTVRWVAANCEAAVHNAASLTFYGEGRNSEPWLSNLDGTRNLLDFCRRIGLRKFHHVSTAYVCGKRRGLIREDELNVGQQLGNDYETSKLQSEQLVRDADFLDNPTVYRPAIIFGDSQTGYTTTYHGFYVPLKLVWTLIGRIASVGVPIEQIAAGIQDAGKRLLEVMNLTGAEHKNFIPVDWVSHALTQLYLRPECHGKTYHLTPRNRVKVEMVQDVFQRVGVEHVASKEALEAHDGGNQNWEEFEKFFFEQMGVYRSYWEDDPEFDSTNTQTALPVDLCPEVDEAMLFRMSRYAVESNFGWPRPKMVKPDFDVESHLGGLVEGRDEAENRTAGHAPADQNGRNGHAHSGPAHANHAHTGSNGRLRHLGLQVNGRGGGQWELLWDDGRVVGAQPGVGRDCTATFYLNSRTFERMAARDVTAADAIGTGRVVIEGNGVPLEQLTQALQTVADKAFELPGL